MKEGYRHISPNELAIKSCMLGALVYNSGFKPDFMIALWRGGTAIGCYVHELLEHKNVHVDHIAIRTSRQPDGSVVVHTLNYVTNNIKEGSKILIIDDVFDSGKSISAVIVKLTGESKIGSDKLDIRIATIFYKPKRNLTYRKPEYYVEETDEWLVFPHEVENMTLEEITTFKGSEIGDIFKNLK